MAYEKRVRIFSIFSFDTSGHYGCSVKSAEITERCEIDRFDRSLLNRLNNVRGFSDKDVYFLEFTDHSIVNYLPRNLHHHFRYLKKLTVHRAELKKISSRDLRGLDHLETLNVSENNIKELLHDLFFYTKRLRVIIFYKNKLEHISSRLLNSFPDDQLREVDFRKNRRYNVLYHPWSHDSVKSIKHLKKKIALQGRNYGIRYDALQGADPSFVKEHHVTKKTPNEFKRLWEDKKLSDFKIIVGRKAFRVHKCVLAVESPVFAAMFENDESVRTSKKFEIEGFTGEVVEVFLHSMYTGQVMTAENALELFNLASTYKVTGLRSIYQKFVLTSLNSHNAVEALRIGNLHHCDPIIEAAFAIVKTQFAKAKLRDGCKNDPKNIETIFRALRLDKK